MASPPQGLRSGTDVPTTPTPSHRRHEEGIYLRGAAVRAGAAGAARRGQARAQAHHGVVGQVGPHHARAAHAAAARALPARAASARVGGPRARLQQPAHLPVARRRQVRLPGEAAQDIHSPIQLQQGIRLPVLVVAVDQALTKGLKSDQ